MRVLSSRTASGNIPLAYFSGPFLPRSLSSSSLAAYSPRRALIVVPVIEVVNHCYLSRGDTGSASVSSRSPLTRKIDTALTAGASERDLER
jgi:hypothetical protein